MNKLRDGDIRVLTGCDIISEGFDAPAVWGRHPAAPNAKPCIVPSASWAMLKGLSPTDRRLSSLTTWTMCPVMACQIPIMNDHSTLRSVPGPIVVSRKWPVAESA